VTDNGYSHRSLENWRDSRPLAKFENDAERCEYFVPIEWIETVPLEQAVKEVGLFGNQNTVCKPTTPKWRSTVERLRQHFRRADS